MPLQTQIKRDGENLRLSWADFHVAAMVIAVAYDSGEGPWVDMPGFVQECDDLMERQGRIGVTMRDMLDLCAYHVIGATSLNGNGYTMKKRIAFVDTMTGEEFVIKPGDVLRAYRTSR